MTPEKADAELRQGKRGYNVLAPMKLSTLHLLKGVQKGFHLQPFADRETHVIRECGK